MDNKVGNGDESENQNLVTGVSVLPATCVDLIRSVIFVLKAVSAEKQGQSGEHTIQ